MCSGSLVFGRPKARSRKRAKQKKSERAKAKTQKIMEASTQERMRLRTRSRRMARMIARMRAKCENDGAEVIIHIYLITIYFMRYYITHILSCKMLFHEI